MRRLLITIFLIIMINFISPVYASCINFEENHFVIKYSKNIKVLCNDQYNSYYHKNMLVPSVVTEKLEKKDFEEKYIRNGKFRADLRLPEQSRSYPSQYTSEFDRGHLSASSNTTNQIYVNQSYLMSNIAPQNPSLNRSTWKRMENWAKWMATQNDYVISISGTLFKSCNYPDLMNGISIPDYFFKILRYGNEMHVFIIDNKRPLYTNIWLYESNLDEVNKRLCGTEITVIN